MVEPKSGGNSDNVHHIDSSVSLEDGRTVTYSEYGRRDGKPVVFLHGTPGSRKCIPDKTAVLENDIRFITIDRPGYGGSDPDSNLTVFSWADDVKQVVDTLEIERFAVVGLSGGGPYALACAVQFPERITKVGVVSGMAPLDVVGSTGGMNLSNRIAMLAGRYVPFILPIALRSMVKKVKEDPQSVVQDAEDRYAQSDQVVMERSEVRETMVDELEEAYRQQSEGHVADLKAVAHNWGFNLDEISIPVRMWHGKRDQNVPLSMAEYVADAIPDSHLTIFPEGGHLIAYEHFDRILKELRKPRV